MRNKSIWIPVIDQKSLKSAGKIVREEAESKQNIVFLLGSKEEDRNAIARTALGFPITPQSPLTDNTKENINHRLHGVSLSRALNLDSREDILINELSFFKQDEESINKILEARKKGVKVIITAKSGKDINKYFLRLHNVTTFTINRDPIT